MTGSMQQNDETAAIGALAEVSAGWGLPLDGWQLDMFARYARELQHWNRQINLTAITDPHAIVVRHFLDSLRLALSWGNAPQSLIDIGSGAGFPGLPLKILRPELRLVLVESIEKKAIFLRELAAQLGLQEVDVLTSRAELVGQMPEHRGAYDVATARAVADLRVLAEYCQPLCRVGGRFLAPKSAPIDEEITQATPAIERLGGRLLGVEPVALPDVPPRVLVVVEQVALTDARYPRAVGIPSKRPL